MKRPKPEQLPPERDLRCGIHGDRISVDVDGHRCPVCDHLAGFYPGAFAHLGDIRVVNAFQGYAPELEVTQDAPGPPWADLLELLPTMADSGAADLKVDDGSVRVWLARTGVADGEPFLRTIYVEALRGGKWMDMGYFDGDEPDPHPVGTLGDGLTATYRRLGVTIR